MQYKMEHKKYKIECGMYEMEYRVQQFNGEASTICVIIHIIQLALFHKKI